MMPKPECHFYPGISNDASGENSTDLSADVAASGFKAARARIRLRYGTLEPVAPMPREKPKRGDRKGQSTEGEPRRVGKHRVEHRGGTIRSSEDALITVRAERRDRVIQFWVNRSTPMRRGRNP